MITTNKIPCKTDIGYYQVSARQPMEIIIDDITIEMNQKMIDDAYIKILSEMMYANWIGDNKKLKNITKDIKNVIFNALATIVFWNDNTKTIVKLQNNEPYDKEKGLAMCIIKKLCDNKGNFNEVFKKWCK